MNDGPKVVQSSREVIERKLLAALDDESKVAILLTKEDLDLFILYFSVTASRKMHQWATDLEQLRREAFGRE